MIRLSVQSAVAAFRLREIESERSQEVLDGKRWRLFIFEVAARHCRFAGVGTSADSIIHLVLL